MGTKEETAGVIEAGVCVRQIEYEPLHSQALFHDCHAKFKGFSGPVGSGKSLALVQESIRLSVVNGGLLGLIGAPTYAMLRDVTQRAIFEELERSSIPFVFKKQENLLALNDLGSEIIFRSLDNPERLRGTNLAWMGIDELTYCREEAWLRLQARLRHPLATELCGFGVWTPNGFDWVYDRFIGPEALSGYEAILAKPRENINLPTGFYDTLLHSYDSKFAAQEVEGQYLSQTSGRVYYAFDRSVHIQPRHYSPYLQLCWTLDFNVNPMASAICQIEDTTSREMAMMGRRSAMLHVLDEIILPDSNTESACAAFAERVAPWIARQGKVSLKVFGDAAGAARSTAGKSDWQIIREFFRRANEFQVSYHVPSANPKVRDRVNAMNSKLRNANGFVGMLVDPKCKHLVKDLEQVTWETDGNGNATGDIDKSNKALTHISDAQGYLVESEFGVKQMGGERSTVLF
jgi:hypothetical protein